MEWIQEEIVLAPRERGLHLVTSEIVGHLPALRGIETGLLHLFILHTSASLSINENADPDVRHDVEAHLNQMVPEQAPYFRHTAEGPDDMPAHIKAMLLDHSLTIPIANGRLRLGTWQGIYLCEHRDHGSRRRLVATIHGKSHST